MLTFTRGQERIWGENDNETNVSPSERISRSTELCIGRIAFHAKERVPCTVSAGSHRMTVCHEAMERRLTDRELGASGPYDIHSSSKIPESCILTLVHKTMVIMKK